MKNIFIALIMALASAGCSEKKPKVVFTNPALTTKVNETNLKEMRAQTIDWITVSCIFTGETQSDLKTVIWYNNGFGDKELRTETPCSSPQNLIMIGWHERGRPVGDSYEIETAQPYDYDVVNGIITTVMNDIKEKGSKL